MGMVMGDGKMSVRSCELVKSLPELGMEICRGGIWKYHPGVSAAFGVDDEVVLEGEI